MLNSFLFKIPSISTYGHWPLASLAIIRYVWCNDAVRRAFVHIKHTFVHIKYAGVLALTRFSRTAREKIIKI